ncbi:MAG: hypothetical protein ACYDBB_00345 [Armatimonadota bacterium]
MAFSEKTFDLLGNLNANRDQRFYKVHESEFRAELVQPFKQLVQKVTSKLPQPVLDTLETEQRIFGSLTRNDFEKDGASANYWAAFCPRRSPNKQSDVQLLTYIEPEYLAFGFNFGWQTSDATLVDFRTRCDQLRCSPMLPPLASLLEEHLPGDGLVLRRDVYPESVYEIGDHDSLVRPSLPFSWKNYFKAVAEAPFHFIIEYAPIVVLPADIVIAMPTDELAERIAQTFRWLFPLVLLATSTDPLTEIRSYLEVIGSPIQRS